MLSFAELRSPIQVGTFAPPATLEALLSPWQKSLLAQERELMDILEPESCDGSRRGLLGPQLSFDVELQGLTTTGGKTMKNYPEQQSCLALH